MKASKAFFLVFLMFYCMVNTRPVKAAENSWETMAEMPTARAGLGVAVVDGKMYAIGGSDGRYLTANEMYDPSKDTWATKKSMPTKRGYFGIAVHQNKVYVIGGETGDGPTGVNEVYDPATDTWETKTSMPTPRENLCAKVVNGKIYLIGGNTFNTLAWPVLSNKTEVYDPSTDSWTTKAAMPNFEGLGFADTASAAVNNKIYVIGGEEWAITDLNQIYDPETDTWSSGTSMPTAVEGPAAGATTGVFAPKRIHVLSMDLHHVYDPETDVWSTGTQMPIPRRHLGVAVINDRLYAIGGGFSGDFGFIETNENEQYTPFGYAHALGTIYIRSDGSVDPDTASIQRDGNVYTLTGDISDSIVVGRDNVVVDGAGYLIEGLDSGLGSPPDGYGILVEGRRNVTISNVAIQHFFYGICLNSSSKNRITKSNITNNSKGIYIEHSSDNLIRENQITNNIDIGIYVFESSDTHIGDNIIADNANDGISLVLASGDLNVIDYCDIRDNGVGIRIMNSSFRYYVTQNNITNNSVGIHLEASSTCIQFNNIANNGVGIQIAGSDNEIDHNNFINNTKQVYDIAWDSPGMSPSVNSWYEGDTGNYWSDYNGTGETPYVIDENNQDNFPVMKPFIIPYHPTIPTIEDFTISNILWSVILIAVVGTALLIYFRRSRKQLEKSNNRVCNIDHSASVHNCHTVCYNHQRESISSDVTRMLTFYSTSGFDGS